MRIHMQREPCSAGAAGFVHGEERGPAHQVVVFDPAQQGDQPLEGFQAGVLGGGPNLGGKVD
jgi:hypothetical protein